MRRGHAVARALGVPGGAVDDVLQEAFFQAFRSLGTLENPGAFGPWFLAIVRNLARKERRAAGRLSLSADLGRRESPAGESLESRELNECLWAEVERLPESVREAVYLLAGAVPEDAPMPEPAGDPAAPAAPAGTVSVRIAPRDRATGAAVRALACSWGGNLETHPGKPWHPRDFFASSPPDADGAFRLQLDPRQYVLRIEAEGYADRVLALDVEPSPGEFAIEPALLPAERLTGVAVDAVKPRLRLRHQGGAVRTARHRDRRGARGGRSPRESAPRRRHGHRRCVGAGRRPRGV